jgi:signal transduction histidine kinase
VKSLRTRLTVWFGLSFLVLTAILMLLTYRDIEMELRHRHWQTDYPTHPDWTLHGSYSEGEIDDVMEDLVEGAFLYVIPLAVGVVILGYLLARKSLRPIASVNSQLQAVRATNLQKKIELAEVDEEFRDLMRHINDLLSRLHTSFVEMSEYAAKVAHELRTPLMIIRLKLEQTDAQINPDLAEELQEELHRLTHVVDQSLLIAKAEQGRVILRPERFDLSKMLNDVVKDFELLAAENKRSVTCDIPPGCWLEADPKYFKQILHSLLTNALKHGQGNIQIRLVRRRARAALIIYNRTQREAEPEKLALGLGMRVVTALVSLHPSLRFRFRRGNDYYSARLALSLVESPKAAAAAPVGAITED